jgi:hypothetical protein
MPFKNVLTLGVVMGRLHYCHKRIVFLRLVSQFVNGKNNINKENKKKQNPQITAFSSYTLNFQHPAIFLC